jgi:N-acetylmuramoyl-L-alanine amidase
LHIVLVLVCYFLSIYIHSAEINSLRISQSAERTRLVFDLSETVDHSMIFLERPDRLVIDIFKTTLGTSFDQIGLNKTPISSIRHGIRNGKDLRIVLDLKDKVTAQSFILGDDLNANDRLVVDLTNTSKNTSKTVEKILERTDRKIIIAIDAGHGGKDPGASGPNRLREKKIVLQIAQKIEKLFDRNPHFDGVLVRTGDYYIDHRKRTAIARENDADFFLSIHADGFPDPRAYGASVYALSTQGATSEAARYLESSENRYDLIGGASDLSIDNQDIMLNDILVDLVMSATLRTSLDAGAYVLKNMGTVARLHKKKVEQAAFLVLKSPDIPSLLIETGFISNPKEAKQLSNSAYQQKMAQAIYAGLYSYYIDRPPVGSSLASNVDNLVRIHVVSRGDTLSEIAVTYGTSMAKILRYNNLSSKVIKIGQKISIPPS